MMNFFNNPFNNRNNRNGDYNQQSSFQPEGEKDNLTVTDENSFENTNKNSFKEEHIVKTKQQWILTLCKKLDKI